MKKLKLLFSCLLPLVKHPSSLLPSIWALLLRLRTSGIVGVKEGLLAIRTGGLLQSDSHLWKAYCRERAARLVPAIRNALREPGPYPLISVVMPTCNTPPKLLRKAVASVQGQWYPNWELCVCDDGSTSRRTLKLLQKLAAADSRIKVKLNSPNGNISVTTNTALSFATGEYVVLMDHDDLLQPQALYRVAELARGSRPDFVYSDEARISSDQDIVELVFRPQFSLERLRAHPYIVHLIAFRRAFLHDLGGLDESLRISQDYDLILRAAEQAETVAHIPEVLYLWRVRKGSAGHVMQKQVMDTSVSILERHLRRCNQPGQVGPGEFFNFFEVRYPLRPDLKVAIVIPTKNRWQLLRQCIDSLESTIGKPDYAIVVIDHQSDEPDSLAYFDALRSRGHTVLRYEGSFNFSRINNFAVQNIDGGFSHYLFCNNDVEAIAPGWLERMAELGQQEDVAVVGVKLLYGDRKTIQHGGVGLGIFAAAEHYGKFADNFLPDGRHNPGYQGNLVCNQELSAVTAACMLVDAAVFRQIGGFDERLAVGFGDVDLCLRARELGYRVLFCPHATLVHYESRTRGLYGEHPEDTALFRERWSVYMDQGDPYFNPNFAPNNYHWAVKNRIPVEQEVRVRVAAGGCVGELHRRARRI
jgi:glycosyltransferase involved in cell wall biosynthesis